MAMGGRRSLEMLPAAMAVEAVRDMLVGSHDGSERVRMNRLRWLECLRNATIYGESRYSSSQPGRFSVQRARGMGANLLPGAGDKVATLSTSSRLETAASNYYPAGKVRKSSLRPRISRLVQQLVDVGQISEEEAETHHVSECHPPGTWCTERFIARNRTYQGSTRRYRAWLCSDGPVW